MFRIINASIICTLLSIILISASISFGDDKPAVPLRQRVYLPVRYATVYGAIGRSGDTFGLTSAHQTPLRNLRSKSANMINPSSVAETSYDVQHNGTMARQIEHRAAYTDNPYSTYIHMDWTALLVNDASLASPRFVGYQAYNVSECATVFAPNESMSNLRAGFCGIDAHNLDADHSWAVGYAHENPNYYIGHAYFDFGEQIGIPTYGLFLSDHPSDRFGYCSNPGTGPDNPNIWPKGSWDIDGADYIFHMVCTEDSWDLCRTCSYYRRVGPYGADEGVWSGQRVIDSVTVIGVTVTSSPISDKVAIVWVAPADYIRDSPGEFWTQYSNDVWFAIANDNGAAWANNPTGMGNPSIGFTVDLGIDGGYVPSVGGNLTSYDSLGDYKAYCDLSALWSVADNPNDWLQIVWGCREWDGSDMARRNGAIFHWDQKYDRILEVARADWDAGGPYVAHAWGSDLAKMTISECEGRLYCTYTQFGFSDEPNGVFNATPNADGNHVIAGQLYTSCYNGSVWDRPQIAIPDDTLPHGSGAIACTSDEYDWILGQLITDGNCSSEYWSSMARYGRIDTCKYDPFNPHPVLDILYINDQAPGGCVQHESGVWVLNPVNWAVDSCRAFVPRIGFRVTPTAFGDCYDEPPILLCPTDVTTVSLTLENPGYLDNTPVSVTPIYVSGGIGNTTVIANPGSGITIPGEGGILDIDLNIVTAAETEGAVVYYDIVIVHQAGENPPTQVVVPMCICVRVLDDNDNCLPLDSAVISTVCRRLRIYNNSRMSANTPNRSFDPTTDPYDCANIYLYDGSPIICRPTPDSFMCWFSAYGPKCGIEESKRSLLPVSPLVVDNTSFDSYTYAETEMMTADGSIGMIMKFYVPKSPSFCEFIIIKEGIFNRTGIFLNNVAWGNILDWDIPGYHANGDGLVNENFYDCGLFGRVAWITNAGDSPPQTDPCDTLALTARYAAIAGWHRAAPFKNSLILPNDKYVYASGLPGNPYPPSVIYDMMSEGAGCIPPPTDDKDLNILTTVGVVPFLRPESAPSSWAIKIILSTDNIAKSSELEEIVELADAFIDDHIEIQEGVPSACDCLPGDPDNNSKFNVGDPVYIINYVFKDGPEPTPYQICSGDANGDCKLNVGDAVYIISYIFRGGPAPVTCEEWRDGHTENPDGCGPDLY